MRGTRSFEDRESGLLYVKMGVLARRVAFCDLSALSLLAAPPDVTSVRKESPRVRFDTYALKTR
jgi:hypothetical protein